jgi:hypothetical protein
VSDFPVYARLRVDTWDPERGASWEADDERTPPDVDVHAEGVPWAPIAGADPGRPVQCAFVDGVRRVDVSLFAETDSVIGPALAGAYAVGAVWAPADPRIHAEHTTRLLILGRDLRHDAISTGIGDHEVYYGVKTTQKEKPQELIQELQTEMRNAEARLATELFRHNQAELVLLDGPLNYDALPEGGAILGLIKRQTVIYLHDAEPRRVQAALEVGQRTPIFRIQGKFPRWSWYVRLAPRARKIDGTLTGIVRLELPGSVELEQARAIADLTAAILPGYASQAGHDPRAPQNLYPVGRLEAELRNRLGHPQLVRRAIENYLWDNENA